MFAPLVISYLLAAQAVPVQDTTAQKLAKVVILDSADRRQGYSTARSRTATRTDTPLRDVPQSATVVTRALIADQAMQNMADVVRYVPGITMGQGEGHRDAPTIRGQSSTADFFVDGVRDDAQYFRDLYNVERVEALKGPNAMTFGRGGGGGIINRVTKQPTWNRAAALGVELGSFDHKRTTIDLNGPLAARAALRLSGLHENSGGFRQGARLERLGVNPEVAIALSARTSARVGAEHFSDNRTVDRGIPSYQGSPWGGDVRRFFGDPAASHSRARVDAARMTIAHRAPGGIQLRTHAHVAAYDKFYQNVFAGSAVNAAGSQLTLSAYNSAIGRTNLFNQTDITASATTGAVVHTLLAGAEFGRQASRNHRNTGYFGSATSSAVTVNQPSASTPVSFRQSATDADNHVVASVAGAYVQDQLALGAHLQAIIGLRADRIAVRYHNNRNDANFERTDRVVSPRVGLIVKPLEAMSLYATRSVSWLPGSGDQFSSLTVTTQTLEPERFVNQEIGVKWDANADASVTVAVYGLDRSNSVVPDPADPTKVVQTGWQRTTGVELGASGRVTSRWQLAAGFAAQRARTWAGATTPLVPERTLSVWNKVHVAGPLALGLGVVRQGRAFAAIDNTVTLPAFTRTDAAAYLVLPAHLRAQLNVENLTNSKYYSTSHGNNNIMPGATRTVRVSLNAGLR